METTKVSSDRWMYKDVACIDHNMSTTTKTKEINHLANKLN